MDNYCSKKHVRILTCFHLSRSTHALQCFLYLSTKNMGYPHDVDKIPKSTRVIFRLTQKEYHKLTLLRYSFLFYIYFFSLAFPDTAFFYLLIPTDNSRLISNPESTCIRTTGIRACIMIASHTIVVSACDCDTLTYDS